MTPFMKTTGKKMAMTERRGRGAAKVIRAVRRRLHLVLPHLRMPVDVRRP